MRKIIFSVISMLAIASLSCTIAGTDLPIPSMFPTAGPATAAATPESTKGVGVVPYSNYHPPIGNVAKLAMFHYTFEEVQNGILEPEGRRMVILGGEYSFDASQKFSVSPKIVEITKTIELNVELSKPEDAEPGTLLVAMVKMENGDCFGIPVLVITARVWTKDNPPLYVGGLYQNVIVAGGNPSIPWVCLPDSDPRWHTEGAPNTN